MSFSRISCSETRGVGDGVGNEESGSAARGSGFPIFEHGVEELNPEVIRVLGGRQAEREASSRAEIYAL